MTDTPTPPMTQKQRAGLVDWLRHPCAETPDLDANDMATAADQLEADGETIATLTAERDAAQAEIARLTAALAMAQVDYHIHSLNAEALAEIKATIDGKSDQPVGDIIYGLLAAIKKGAAT